KNEGDGEGIKDLHSQPRLEVKKGPINGRRLRLDVLFPVHLDDFGINNLTIMKSNPLPEGNITGSLIEPPPIGGPAGHQASIFVKFHEMFEDVKHNKGPVRGVLIHNAQFPPRLLGLFPQTTATPPKDDEHEDEATDDGSLHGIPPCLHESKSQGNTG